MIVNFVACKRKYPSCCWLKGQQHNGLNWEACFKRTDYERVDDRKLHFKMFSWCPGWWWWFSTRCRSWPKRIIWGRCIWCIFMLPLVFSRCPCWVDDWHACLHTLCYTAWIHNPTAPQQHYNQHATVIGHSSCFFLGTECYFLLSLDLLRGKEERVTVTSDTSTMFCSTYNKYLVAVK